MVCRTVAWWTIRSVTAAAVRRQPGEEGVDQAVAACPGRLLPYPADGRRGDPEPHLAPSGSNSAPNQKVCPLGSRMGSRRVRVRGPPGQNVIAAPAAYDDAPDLIEGLTAAIVEGYRRGCADRPAATRVFLDHFPGQDARYVEASWARVCALLGDEIRNHTDAGWQTTIDPISTTTPGCWPPHLLTAAVRGRRPLRPITCAASGRSSRGGGRPVCPGAGVLAVEVPNDGREGVRGRRRSRPGGRHVAGSRTLTAGGASGLTDAAVIVPPSMGLSRRCASTPSSKSSPARSSTPSP